MSLIAGGTALLGQLQAGKKLLGGFQKVLGLGGGGGPNIARNLSKELGCTVLQENASQARALRDRGVNVCNPQRLVTLDDFRDRPTAGPLSQGELAKVIRQPVPGAGTMSLVATTGSAAGFPVVRSALTGLAGVLRTATGRISSVVLPSGQKFSRRRAAALIRKFGMEAAAVALGIGVVEAAEILLADSQASGRRSRRGISGAQLANAKRVNRKIMCMARDLESTCKRAPARRKPSCR